MTSAKSFAEGNYTMKPLLHNGIAAAVGGLGLGLGLYFLILYIFSGGLIFPELPDWRFLFSGILFLLGGPVAYGLYLQRSIRSGMIAIMAVGVGGITAYALAFGIKVFLFRGSNFFQDVNLLAVLLAALVITIIQGTGPRTHWKIQRVRLVASATLVVIMALTLLWTNKIGVATNEPSEGFWFGLIFYPTLVWIGVVVFAALIEHITQSLQT